MVVDILVIFRRGLKCKIVNGRRTTTMSNSCDQTVTCTGLNGQERVM